MTELVKFLHVMLGTTLLGLVIASYFYVTKSSSSKSILTYQHTIKLTRLADLGIFLPIILFEFITGTFLIKALDIPITTPWIIVAYTMLSVATVLVIINWRLKTMPIQSKPSYHIINGLIILVLCLIIHDAVMHNTLFHRFWQ